jgi:hypothetical protein
MSTNVKDFDDVRAVVQLYVDGSNGDVLKLQRAFHPAARMAGRFGAELDDNTRSLITSRGSRPSRCSRGPSSARSYA